MSSINPPTLESLADTGEDMRMKNFIDADDRFLAGSSSMRFGNHSFGLPHLANRSRPAVTHVERPSAKLAGAVLV